LRRAELVFYVSGHGFGHATRVAAILAALRARAGPRLRVAALTEAPAWILREADPAVHVAHAALDPGVLQQSALDVDVAATARAHAALGARFEALAAREAERLRAWGARLVAADATPLACAAAARAGVAARLVSNFTWDWVLGAWGEHEPALASAAARYRAAHALAEAAHRLPFHAGFAGVRRILDTPHVAREARLPREAVRARLGLAGGDSRPLVLVSFGGHGHGALGRGRVDVGEDFVFTGFGAPPAALAAHWRPAPRELGLSHADLVAGADVLLGKTGYSTVAEALAHRTRFLYVPREDYAEARILAAGLEREGCARPLPRAALEAGRWRAPLEALLATPRPARAPRSDGARVVAEALLEALLRRRATSS
jgi:hypothetical protein